MSRVIIFFSITFIFLFFLGNLLLLNRLNFPIFLQLICYAELFYLFLIGYGFIMLTFQKQSKDLSILVKTVISFFIGTGFAPLVALVFFDKSFLDLVSGSKILVSWLILLTLSPLAIFGFRHFVKKVKGNIQFFLSEIWEYKILILVGSAVAILTCYGYWFYVEKLPFWGSHGDRDCHFVWHVSGLGKGIPSGMINYGVELLFYWLASVCPGLIIWNVHKPAMIIFFLGIPLFAYLVSKEGLQLPRWLALISGIISLFWGPINSPLFNLTKSHYHGAFIGGGSCAFYFNTTQTVSYSLCAAAGYLIIRCLKLKLLDQLTLPALLLSLSFFFKPLAYIVFGPTLFLLFLFFYRSIPFKKWVVGVSILFAPIVLWNSYPCLKLWLTGESAGMLSSSVTIAPFASSLVYSHDRFYSFIEHSIILKCLAIAACSYFIFLAAVLVWLFQRRFNSKEEQRIILFSVVILLLGIMGGTLLSAIEYTWATQVSEVFFIPFMVKIIFDCRSPILRLGFVIVSLLHLWGGALHFYLNITGRG